MATKSFGQLLKFLITWGSVAYLIALVLLFYALEHCTERQWYLSPPLYLPPQGWLLPLLVLTPLAIFVRPIILPLHLLAAVVVFAGFMHFHSPPKGNSETYSADSVLTVITANIGQRKPQTLQPFLDAMDADIIAFQESIYGKKSFNHENAGYNFRVENEFSFASKLPITASGLVPGLTFEGRSVAAWFELKYQNRAIVVYSVHMPTPRSYFFSLRGRGFLVESELGGGIFSKEVQEEYAYYWSTRFELARALLAVLEKEKRPALVVGDFNTPDHGALYKLFTARLTDTFAATGKGYGETFPGNTRMPITCFRPWLRLDYLFASADWLPIECAVEPLTHAQHLAVMASYQLQVEK